MELQTGKRTEDKSSRLSPFFVLLALIVIVPPRFDGKLVEFRAG